VRFYVLNLCCIHLWWCLNKVIIITKTTERERVRPACDEFVDIPAAAILSCWACISARVSLAAAGGLMVWMEAISSVNNFWASFFRSSCSSRFLSRSSWMHPSQPHGNWHYTTLALSLSVSVYLSLCVCLSLCLRPSVRVSGFLILTLVLQPPTSLPPPSFSFSHSLSPLI